MTERRGAHQSEHLILPCSTEAMYPARAAALQAAGVTPESQVGWAIELLVSELVANAVIHSDAPADEPIELDVVTWRDRIEVGVIDHGTGPFAPPADMPADRSAVCGRGLALVARLADSWGIERGRERTRVWFALALA